MDSLYPLHPIGILNIVHTAHWRIRIFDDKLDSNNNDNYYYYYCARNRIYSMEIIIIYVHRIEKW